MLWILTPRSPTQEPTGSTPCCFARTATLLLDPLSLATATISTDPLYISGTSCSNNLINKSSEVLETISSGPLVESWSIVLRTTFILAPCLYRSELTC